ncbi:hypothetical protein SAMN02745135_02291 [Caloranaerobacter azorensis DSM 13643]|uniref:Uncharacterized protein n=1 Tax=Caloranaerobacter azorensis DSM 13643 TaxID=1121264 RepID=A0A1M5W4N2_9FIRM|nr:hypothetical protein [Caloranaerobacter azorensis]SHH82420.1 hypothetical protein SAMN02745135_02291 [Caloranaerobacter azorensis DSM 13643]
MDKQEIFLAKDEDIIKEQKFAYSTLMPFIKSKFKITNKRILGSVPNLFWLILLGSNDVTYPIKNIAGVRIDNKFNIKKIIIGIILALFGLNTFSDTFFGGLVLILLGIMSIIEGIQCLIVIQSTGGSSINYKIAPYEKNKAQEFINKLNMIIAETI